MLIKGTALLGIVAATLLCGCSQQPQLFADIPAARNARVEVLEADALVIDGRHVRLSNAAAPQSVPRARCWAEALAARQARETVQGLVAAAHDVTVTATGGVDEYNRSLSRVSLDGLDLGQTLRDRGMAATPGEQPFDWCAPVSVGASAGPSLATLADIGG